MKKLYSKPSVILMELRPEEKLSMCDWPKGLMATVCSDTDTWENQSGALYDQCRSMIINVLVAGS